MPWGKPPRKSASIDAGRLRDGRQRAAERAGAQCGEEFAAVVHVNVPLSFDEECLLLRRLTRCALQRSEKNPQIPLPSRHR